jgi:hypothetical protein
LSNMNFTPRNKRNDGILEYWKKEYRRQETE